MTQYPNRRDTLKGLLAFAGLLTTAGLFSHQNMQAYKIYTRIRANSSIKSIFHILPYEEIVKLGHFYKANTSLPTPNNAMTSANSYKIAMQKDYHRENILYLDGWCLSHTEAQLCAQLTS